jgi:hypothetical protein
MNKSKQTIQFDVTVVSKEEQLIIHFDVLFGFLFFESYQSNKLENHVNFSEQGLDTVHYPWVISTKNRVNL